MDHWEIQGMWTALFVWSFIVFLGGVALALLIGNSKPRHRKSRSWRRRR